MVSALVCLASTLLANGSLEGSLAGWDVFLGDHDAAVSHDAAGGSIRFARTVETKGGQSLAHQVVTLDQSRPAPFAYACWTRCADLPEDAVPSHTNYGIELCVAYQDGTKQWLAPKTCPNVGTHDWERLAGSFVPPRPVKTVTFYARSRLPGTVWYDDFTLDAFAPPRENLAGCRAVTTGDAVTLENDYVKLVFDPTNGGTCRSFIVKRDGAEYAGEKHHEARMFADRLRRGGNCFHRIYKAEILSNTRDEAAIRLSVTAPEGYPFLVIEKTFRLSVHSAAVTCTYALRNLPEAMAPVTLEPHFRQGWSLRANEEQHYFLPTEKGVRTFGPRGGDTYVTNAVAGWVAAGDGKSRALACTFDYTHLAHVYFWLGGMDNTTSEWTFQPVEIPAGGAFETTETLFPVNGLGVPDRVENGLASGFVAGEDGYHARLAAAATHLLEAEVRIVPKRGEKRKIIKTVQVSPDDVVDIPLQIDAKEAKGLRVTLRDGDRVVYEQERVFAPGYRYRAREAKHKPAEIRPFELKLSEQVATPHETWMKPWAGGKPRVLFLADLRQQREVVELAQRMDLDHRVVRLATAETTILWGMCDLYNRYTLADANQALRRELAKPLDAVVLSGDLWRVLDAESRAAVKRAMAAGVGYVEIGRVNGGVLGEHLPAVDAAGTAYITNAVSPVLLPFGAGRATAYRLGTARSVRFDYKAQGGLTPFVPFDAPVPGFRYQDYSLGLLARAIAWAAKCDVAHGEATRREKSFAAGGLHITHTWFADAKGRIVDWRAEATGTPTLRDEPWPRICENAITNEMPFFIGDSEYRSGLRRYLAPYRYAECRKLGINGLRFWHNEPNAFFAKAQFMGFALNFPITGAHLWDFTKQFAEPYAKTHDKTYLCRKPCYHDTAAMATHFTRMRTTIDRLGAYGPVSFDCGDEDSLTLWGTPFDFCFSDHTLAAFRTWLIAQYGSLERLNRAWGTHFADLSLVVPLTTEEARTQHAQDRQWAAWADHRRFMELTFCGYFRKVREIMREKAPAIQLDMSGTQQPNGWTGMDMWLLSDVIDLPSSYDENNLCEIVRSFGRPLIKPWYGYGASGPDVARRVWFDALRFKNFGVSYFTGDNVLNPDYTVPKQVQELVDALKFFREGGAALVKTLDEEPQVLIHYSQASVHVAQIEKRYDAFLAARATWCTLLDDLMVPYRFVAYGELENGVLDRTTAKVVILPESTALSEKEIAALRRFAAKGGCVVGDGFTGTHDIHCNWRPTGALDDLFAAGNGAAVRMPPLRHAYRNYRKMADKTDEARNYLAAMAKPWRRFLPKGEVQLTSEGVPCIRAFMMHNAAGERYLGFVREGEVPTRNGCVHVDFARPAHVRDLRTGKDLGRRTHMDVTLPAYGTTLLSW